MNKNSNLAQVFHFDLQGKRDFKYDFLNQNSLATINWNELQPEAPNFFLVKKNFDQSGMYEMGFKVDELFLVKSSGVKTHDDENLIGTTKIELECKVRKKGIIFDILKPQRIAYRPFENGYVYYDTKILGRAREKTIYHLLHDNLGLNLVSQPQAANLNYFDCIFIANRLTDTNMFRRGGPVVFPLYLYPEANAKDLFAKTERTPNLNKEIVAKIAEGIGLTFTAEKEITKGTFAPIDILDYIYAVLHSPTYREKYKEFLKIDFPRVPYPIDLTTFQKLSSLGSQLRQLHLLESPTVEKYITQYPIDGDNVVGKLCFVILKDFVIPKYEESEIAVDARAGGPVVPHHDKGRVYINDTQYFDNVPEVAWTFYIGGYQPAQKWLKDRREHILEFEDILHYQKIIVALTQTHRLMTEIDKIEIEA